MSESMSLMVQNRTLHTGRQKTAGSMQGARRQRRASDQRKQQTRTLRKEMLDAPRRDRRIQTVMRAKRVSVSDQGHVRLRVICVSRSNPSVFGRDIQSVTPVDALHIKSHTCFPVKTKRLLEEKPQSRRFLNSKVQSLTVSPYPVNLKISQNSHWVR